MKRKRHAWSLELQLTNLMYIIFYGDSRFITFHSAKYISKFCVEPSAHFGTIVCTHHPHLHVNTNRRDDGALSPQLINRLIEETSSGAVLANDCLVHYSVSSLPFGGVGKYGCHATGT